MRVHMMLPKLHRFSLFLRCKGVRRRGRGGWGRERGRVPEMGRIKKIFKMVPILIEMTCGECVGLRDIQLAKSAI